MENCKVLLDDEEIYPIEEKSKYSDAQYICQLRFNGHLATIKSKEQYKQVKSALKNCNTENDQKWIVGLMLDGGDNEEHRWADGSEFNLDSNKHLFPSAFNFSLLDNSCRVPYMTTHPAWDSIYLSTKNNCGDEFNYLCATHRDIQNPTTPAPGEMLDPSSVLVPLITVLLIAVFGVFVYRREQKKKRNKREVEMKENVIYGVSESAQHCEMKDNVLYGEACPHNDTT